MFQRSLISFFGLFFCVLVACHNSASDDQIMSTADQTSLAVVAPEDVAGFPIATPIRSFVDMVRLKAYKAGVEDLSFCKDDKICLKQAQKIKRLQCAIKACEQQDGTQKGEVCFEDLINGLSAEIKNRFNASFCEFIRDPENSNQRVLMDLNLEITEKELIRVGAYILALEKSSQDCENHIKKFIGPYGPKWSYSWYKVLSGCRILAHESQPEQEEKDFYTWFGVDRKFTCTGIMNNDLRMACETQTAASPKPPQEIMFESAQNEPLPIESLLEQLRLKIFKASDGDLSICQNDEKCLEGAKKIKAWRCIADVCSGKITSQEPFSCLEGFSSPEDQNKINELMCSYIKSPDSVSRQEIRKYMPGTTEDELIELEAYYLALNESAGSCQNYIKFHVREFGSQWNYKWYRALSGCRLLTGESTLEQEESDFYTWFGVERRFNCSEILNSEFGTACQIHGSAAPRYDDEE